MAGLLGGITQKDTWTYTPTPPLRKDICQKLNEMGKQCTQGYNDVPVDMATQIVTRYDVVSEPTNDVLLSKCGPNAEILRNDIIWWVHIGNTSSGPEGYFLTSNRFLHVRFKDWYELSFDVLQELKYEQIENIDVRRQPWYSWMFSDDDLVFTLKDKSTYIMRLHNCTADKMKSVLDLLIFLKTKRRSA